jgi:acyl-CoA thioesterase II
VAGSQSGWKTVRRLVGVEVLDESHARGETGPARARRGLFGGQMIAQSLSACAHTVPAGSVPDSLHANLLRGGHLGEPVEFSVERVRDGRALQHREVRGYQRGELIVQTTVVSSVPIRGLDWQSTAEADFAAPDLAPTGPRSPFESLGDGAFETAYPVSGGDGPRPAHPLWIRSVEELPDDPWLQGAVRAYWSDYGINGAARTTHNELDDQPVSSVSATHSVWFHRPTPCHQWHLLDVHTRSLFSNQAFVHASLLDAGGRLSASVAQGVFLGRPSP